MENKPGVSNGFLDRKDDGPSVWLETKFIAHLFVSVQDEGIALWLPAKTGVIRELDV